MATPTDLLLAILALDAYNRGDSPGMLLPSSTQIGDATVVATAVDQAASFYAVKHGFRAPIAVVTWTFVSDEVDQLLQKQAESLRRLRPDQWNSGTIAWLIDAAGDAEGVRRALHWLAAGLFKERSLKMSLPGAGGTTVTTLEDLLAERSESASLMT